MFYEKIVQGFMRIPPNLFSENTEEAILKTLNMRFENYISEKLGIVVCVGDVFEIGEGIIIPGDGAAYYKTKFSIITYQPEMKEIVMGEVSDITDFGAFLNIGAIDGMIHVSQTMDDYVTFSKSNVLTGKETKKTIKVGDKCRAMVIAISYKEVTNPKLGLTMRQPWLGPLEHIKHDMDKATEKSVEKTGEPKKEKAKA